jgi:hypothetical protein
MAVGIGISGFEGVYTVYIGITRELMRMTYLYIIQYLYYSI